MMGEDAVEAVAKAISGAPFPSQASYRKARLAIEAYERVQERLREAKARMDNVAWLQANIAQVEQFMKRSEAEDPIGYHQWRHRHAELQARLETALAAEDNPL